jgi:hypothetical protein
VSLLDGVPSQELAAVTDLGDVVYQHDDHHRALASAIETLAAGATADYTEFLTDAQTPYYVNVGNSVVANWPFSDTTRDFWVGEASRFVPTYPQPAFPLDALTDPYIGPGVVDDPIGWWGDEPYYSGPGIFRFLKTGTYSLDFFLQIELPEPAAAAQPVCGFHFWAEDGVNQKMRAFVVPDYHGNKTTPTGPMALNSFQAHRPWFSGSTRVTVVEADRVDGYPTLPEEGTPGGLKMEDGIVPVGWDCYPTFEVTHPTWNVQGFQMDHMGFEIKKVA